MIELKTATVYTVIIGSVGFLTGTLTSLLGGWDVFLEHLMLFIVIDFLFGLAAAWVGASKKTESGYISSTAMYHGILKKIGMVAVVIVFEGLDTIFEIDYLRNGIVLSFIACETVSILENAVMIGLPSFLGKYKIVIENLFDAKHKK